MILKYTIAILGITGLMLLWVLVQHFWRNVFLDQQSDEDVLAGRSDCGSCGCSTICERKKTELKK